VPAQSPTSEPSDRQSSGDDAIRKQPVAVHGLRRLLQPEVLVLLSSLGLVLSLLARAGPASSVPDPAGWLDPPGDEEEAAIATPAGCTPVALTGDDPKNPSACSLNLADEGGDSGALGLTTSTPTPSPRPVAYSPPTRLLIPKLGVDVSVVEVGYETKEISGTVVTSWNVADFAAGFHSGSAYPGHPGNTVIAGHNNIRGRVFRHLVDLLPGDDVYLYVGSMEFHYVVDKRLLVQEKGMTDETQLANARWIQPTTDERLTLVSCWPFLKPDHRVVVVAFPAP